MSSPISAPNITSISDIPNLSDLYASRDLPEPQDEPRFPYNAGMNKRVSIWRGELLKVGQPFRADATIQGDITKLRADIIVNAANRSLLGGGGVDGAIHRAAGPELYEECKGLNGAETGETKVTMAYDLPSTRIAHTVGPIYSSRHVGESEELLASCYQTSLEACAAHGGGSIGFSSISTGIYGYPIIDATRVALDVTREFLQKNTSVSRVVFVVFSKRDEAVYQGLAPEYFPGPRQTGGSRDAGDGEAAGGESEEPVKRSKVTAVEGEGRVEGPSVTGGRSQEVEGNDTEASKDVIGDRKGEDAYIKQAVVVRARVRA